MCIWPMFKLDRLSNTIDSLKLFKRVFSVIITVEQAKWLFYNIILQLFASDFDRVTAQHNNTLNILYARGAWITVEKILNIEYLMNTILRRMFWLTLVRRLHKVRFFGILVHRVADYYCTNTKLKYPLFNLWASNQSVLIFLTWKSFKSLRFELKCQRPFFII